MGGAHPLKKMLVATSPQPNPQKFRLLSPAGLRLGERQVTFALHMRPSILLQKPCSAADERRR
jgi:hypothetical protein